jgi:hypothetical protein
VLPLGEKELTTKKFARPRHYSPIITLIRLRVTLYRNNRTHRKAQKFYHTYTECEVLGVLLPATTETKTRKKRQVLTKIDHLDPSIRAAIDLAISQGDSGEKISAALKTDHGVEISADTICRYMRKKFPTIVKHGLDDYKDFLKKLPIDCDAAKSLNELLVIQKARIGTMIAKEAENQKTSVATDKAMKEARETAEAICQLEMDMGVRKRAQPKDGVGTDEDVMKIMLAAIERAGKKHKNGGDTTAASNVQQPGCTAPSS